MSSEIVNWISITGSFLSLAGVIIAVWQIYKTRRVAEAAKDAALKTQEAISRNLLLSDVSTCAKNIEEIKYFTRNEKYESALIRLTDLVAQLRQLKETLENSNQPHQIEFKENLSQLAIMRGNFEKKLTRDSVKINVVQVNSQLSEISDELNSLIGKVKLAIKEDE